MGCSPWGRKESDTEELHFHFSLLHWRRKWQPTPVYLAWRIPGTGEPGGLLSVGSHRVGHEGSDLSAAGSVLHQVVIFLFSDIPLLNRVKSFTLRF